MKKGFTIIELLMAVALTIVIGMLISMAFYNTQLASQRATSTLSYQVKGRAIMDLIARDIGNAVINASVSNSKPALLNTDKGIALKTILPVQRSQYQDPASDSLADAKSAGYFRHDIAQVGWCYTAATATEPAKLFRRASTVDDAYNNSGATILANPHFDSTNNAAIGTLAGDLVTSEDIRKFRVTALTNGGKTVGYNVSFWLTSAPDSLIPDTMNFEGAGGARAKADADNHIIVEFTRNIAVPAFTP